jgi:hypothetical protein
MATFLGRGSDHSPLGRTTHPDEVCHTSEALHSSLCPGFAAGEQQTGLGGSVWVLRQTLYSPLA